MIYTRKFNRRFEKLGLLGKLENHGFQIIEKGEHKIVAKRGSALAVLYSGNITKYKTTLTIELGESTVFSYNINTKGGLASPGDEAKLDREMGSITNTPLEHSEKKVDLQSSAFMATNPESAWMLAGIALASFIIFPFMAIIVILFGSISLYQVLKYKKNNKIAGILVLAIILGIISQVLSKIL